MQAGLISVLLPLYNQKHMLKEAVESVLAQTYPFFELLILNDGSTDDPDDVLKGFTDSRIKYYVLEHRGLPQTLNTGLQLADGEYVTWTSADNILLPDMFAELLAALAKSSKYSAAYAGYYHIDEKGKIIGQNPKGPYVYDPERFASSRMRDYMVTQHCNFGAAFLYRSRACSVVGEFDLECEGAEDLDYSIRIAKSGPVVYVPKILYKYRLHLDSMTGREQKGEVSYKKSRDRFWQKVINHEYTGGY